MSVGPVMGSIDPQKAVSAGSASGAAKASAEMMKSALKTPAEVARSSGERIVQELKASSNVKLFGLGLPENSYGIMAGFRAAATSVQEKMARKIAEETGQGLMKGNHLVALGVPGKAGQLFQKCIGQ
jgi:hypothetical protein